MSGAEDGRRDAVAIGEETRSDRKDSRNLLAPVPDVGGGSIAVVAQERALDASEQTAGFFGDLGEHVLREDFLGDERPHPPEGGLLVEEPLYTVTGIAVGDRGREKLREARQPVLR